MLLGYTSFLPPIGKDHIITNKSRSKAKSECWVAANQHGYQAFALLSPNPNSDTAIPKRCVLLETLESLAKSLVLGLTKTNKLSWAVFKSSSIAISDKRKLVLRLTKKVLHAASDGTKVSTVSVNDSVAIIAKMTLEGKNLVTDDVSNTGTAMGDNLLLNMSSILLF